MHKKIKLISISRLNKIFLNFLNKQSPTTKLGEDSNIM